MKKHTARLMLFSIPFSLLCGSHAAYGAKTLSQPQDNRAREQSAIATTLPPQGADSTSLSRRQIDATVYFRVGQSRIDPAYEGNRQRLDAFISALQQMQTHPDGEANRIVVTGTASPDGTQAHNLKLAEMRAQALAAYIASHTSLHPDSIRVVNAGENWTALRALIESSQMTGKEGIIQLMNRYADNHATLKYNMQQFAGGTPWAYMHKHFFPALRQGILLHTSLNSPPTPEPAQAVAPPAPPTHQEETPLSHRTADSIAHQTADSIARPVAATPIATPLPASSGCLPRVPLVALKTDLMLWTGFMPGFGMGTWTPNLSVEFYLARRWSVQLGGAYANWNAITPTQQLYALSVADAEVRLWLGKPDRFRGFYLGVYGQYGQYDVQEGTQGQTGSFGCAGLGAGYLLPLSCRWALDAGIRGGYRTARNEVYDIEQEHTYYNNEQTNGKFTPQFRLQVVYRFGKKQK